MKLYHVKFRFRPDQPVLVVPMDLIGTVEDCCKDKSRTYYSVRIWKEAELEAVIVREHELSEVTEDDIKHKLGL